VNNRVPFLAKVPNGDFLLIQDPLCRPPLQQWAQSIRNSLEIEMNLGGDNQIRIASLLNLAAFVEIMLGDKIVAKAICDAELAWLANFATRITEFPTISALAIQPWINIGRLLRIEGKLQEALWHFALVMREPTREPLLLGPYCIPKQDWEELLASDVGGNLWNIYVVDSLKTYFKCRRFDVAVEFIAKLRKGRLHFRDNLLLEGEVISHIGLGDYERSYWLAKSRAGLAILDTVAFMLYEAHCSVELNRHDGAVALTRDLKSFVVLGGFDSFAPPTAMRCLEKLGVLLERLGQQVDAAQIYERAYKLALSANDQPFQISFLSAWARQPGCGQSPKLKETRSTLLSDCYYHDILRSETLPGQRRCQAFSNLRVAVSMATGGAFAEQSGH
jgi:tetratricopeptide (TPR) repeat protein